MEYSLPKTVQVGDQQLRIRYDFRVILTILEALNDPDLNDVGKAQCLLELFYYDPVDMRHGKEAVEACYRFIDLGEKEEKKSPRVMDWQQDFKYIIAPVNRVLGYEARNVDYDFDANTGGLHWWTFMAAYMEIGGECTFSQIVSIRDKQARGKKLEKHEKEWLSRNRNLVDFRQKFSEAETDLAKEWMGKNG
jgi:hypothetical protein